MYYVLEMDLDVAVMAGFEESHPGHDLKWLRGRLFGAGERPQGLRVLIEEAYDEYEGGESAETTPPEPYPDFFELMRVPIGSERLRRALIQVGVDSVEYYPTSMVETSGRIVTGHLALNVVGLVDAIDRAASDLVLEDDHIVRIRSLALREDATHGLRLFRLEGYLDILLVDQQVADAVRPLSGVRLSPAQGWSDDYRF